jgi:hypothetical protein
LNQGLVSSSSGQSIVKIKVMKSVTRAILNLADLPLDERMELNDQITEQALALWRKKGRGHLNALDALLQAEREMLARKKAS